MIVFLTTVLVLLCLLVILLILIQRTSGGMGSALGGGAADQVLGAGSAAQLSKITVYGILGFFVLSFALYAFYQKEADRSEQVIRAGETLQSNRISLWVAFHHLKLILGFPANSRVLPLRMKAICLRIPN